MLQRTRDQVGTAGLLVAIIALIAALGGGAYAASGGLTGKQKKEVTKIAQAQAKKLAPAGPAGPEGHAGAKGDAGAPGAPGAPGANGAGVTVKPYVGEECGTEEGTEFTNSTGTSFACNGENGETGFTTTLPSGKVEHGVWSVGPYPGVTENRTFAPVSFAIPLGAAEVPVHYMAEGVTPTTACPGTIAAPLAAKGNVCVYASFEEETAFLRPNNPEKSTETAGPSGTLLLFELESEEAKARGVWVATAP
jgi:hypothetical protein